MSAASQTRQRILDAAYGIFWRQGFMRPSLDDIARRAKLTKRTLYQHFRSKDDLMAEVLAHSSELAMESLRHIGDNLPTDCDAMIDSLFARLADWAMTPRYSGAGFSRVVAELADLPGHPARKIARRHKASFEGWLSQRLALAKVPAPEERGRELALLVEGTMMLLLIHGDRAYALAAAQAARTLFAPGAGSVVQGPMLAGV
jgi:AcrR family transcriptional regulator